MQSLNLLVRFLLEILALVIYGYWGFKSGKPAGVNWIMGAGTPLTVALLWGIFGSPKAPVPLSGLPRLWFEIVLFGMPVFLLIVVKKPLFAVIYGGLFVFNKFLMYVWHQY